MPFVIGCLALSAPRLVLFLVAVFSNYIGRAYQTALWPILGFFFMPLTTLVYAWAINSHGAVDGAYLVVVVIAAQQLTDNLVTPRVMSAQVDLHPTLVIFSLLVGCTLFGIIGLLVAIPLAATVKALAVYYWELREHHPLSGPIEPQDAIPASPPPDPSRSTAK